ncbi:hypothetical protein [Haloechinothrix aidingensis]|uniref:hypothetical protein n=1 Tax=Haloechinothrix aidingensis TaxID=2752311 RepID=UPI0031B5E5E9
MIGWLHRLLGDRLPAGFTGTLAPDEHVLASGESDQGPVVATSQAVWLPGSDGSRRVEWHVVAKATWAEPVLTVVEAEEIARPGGAVLLSDRQPVRVRLDRPGKLPRVVRERVDASIRSRYYKELPGGGAWFVQRKVPGTGGVVLQALAEPGTDRDAVAGIAREAAERLSGEQA